MNKSTSLPKSGLLRRLAACLYDGFIIIAIEMMAAGIVVAILEALVAAGVMDYGSYIDVSDYLSRHPIWSNLFTAYLAIVWLGFFIYFWSKAGQTIGMRAWKLRIQNSDGSNITTTQAVIRVATSAFGLSNLCVPLDHKKRGFQDIWAHSEVVVLPKAN
ncbi:RDD family protein [Vibrio gallicus]|uniref:RDD family protein n=1 Tax=Vibrio gallicus TaxID=190897 RepID=UPI0021C450AB|nr:RDD family protein [Vibrio gallicus]